MLPNINLNPITKDDSPAKQIASLRSQLAQLKDGVEESLNNISYDNLNAALRKKIDAIDDIKVYAQDQVNIVAQTITADVLKVTGDIQSINGNITTINGNISAINGTVSGLRGDFNSLSAKAITTDTLDVSTLITTSNLQAQSIKASQINSGKITASQINAHSLATSLFTGEDLVVNELTCNLDASFDSIDVAATASCGDLKSDTVDTGTVTADVVKATYITPTYVLGHTVKWMKRSEAGTQQLILVATD